MGFMVKFQSKLEIVVLLVNMTILIQCVNMLVMSTKFKANQDFVILAILARTETYIQCKKGKLVALPQIAKLMLVMKKL